MILAGGNNITLSQDGASITIVAPNLSAGAISVGAGTITATRDQIIFSNNNSISFGMSGSTITGSIPIGQANFSDNSILSWGSSVGTGASSLSTSIYIASRAASGIALSIGSGNIASSGSGFVILSSGSMNLIGGNNITIVQNGSLIQVDGGAAGGIGTVFSTVSTNGSVLTGALGTAGMSLSVPAWLTAASGAGISYELEGNNTSGTTGSNVNTLYFSGGDNVTLSGNSNTIVISAAAGGAGAALQGSGTYSQNSGTIQFANSNNVTFGLTNNSMTASIPIGTVNFSDGSGISWGSSVNGVSTTITASVVVPAGNNVFFVNTNGHSFSSSSSGVSTYHWIVI
jgi:hypothetical protein